QDARSARYKHFHSFWTGPSDRKGRAMLFRSQNPLRKLIAVAVALAIPFSTTGCSSSESPSSSETSTSSGDEGLSGGGQTKSDVGESSGDAISGGMQLPDDAVPSGEESNSDSGGPAMPGEGGMEMPDAPGSDLGSASSAGPSESSASVRTVSSETRLVARLAAWDEIQATATSTGKVTVVDLWSLACEPCLKEFPGLVKLDQMLGSEVTCIGVSTDFDGRKSKPAETYQPRVDAFLRSTGATFDNFICQTPNNDVYDELGLLSIPAVLIFDANGKLVRQFVDGGETKGFGYERDIFPFVESILSDARSG
ncbi:MAG: TlpA disulfide reductase family protein, partial [Planctomycetota bacterium]